MHAVHVSKALTNISDDADDNVIMYDADDNE